MTKARHFAAVAASFVAAGATVAITTLGSAGAPVANAQIEFSVSAPGVATTTTNPPPVTYP